MTRFRRTDYRKFCQFCLRPSVELEVLVVCALSKCSICDSCAQMAIDSAQEHQRNLSRPAPSAAAPDAPEQSQ